MAIPNTVPKTTAGYLEFLGDSINLADKLWTHYAWAVSSAYVKAYQANQLVLNRVKVIQEQHRAADEAFMSFALSLLTVGVAGGVAGAVARKFSKSLADNSKVAEDAAKDVVKWSMQKASTPLVGAVSSALSPDVASKDVFAPSDVTPEDYTTSLQEGITWNVAFLTKILYEVKWDPDRTGLAVQDKYITVRSGGQLTTDGMELLTETIMDSSFMNEMPQVNLDVKTLTRKASLALWIGWALARDAKYWKRGKDLPPRVDQLGSRIGFDASWEQLDWEPVRSALIGLGVPQDAVTVEVKSDRRGVIARGLDMWGFMDWASSPHSLALLFDRSLPKHPKGFEMATKGQARRKLTDNGWTGSPFTPTMTPQ